VTSWLLSGQCMLKHHKLFEEVVFKIKKAPLNFKTLYLTCFWMVLDYFCGYGCSQFNSTIHFDTLRSTQIVVWIDKALIHYVV
jgi:hypothetical protein